MISKPTVLLVRKVDSHHNRPALGSERSSMTTLEQEKRRRGLSLKERAAS